MLTNLTRKTLVINFETQYFLNTSLHQSDIAGFRYVTSKKYPDICSGRVIISGGRGTLQKRAMYFLNTVLSISAPMPSFCNDS